MRGNLLEQIDAANPSDSTRTRFRLTILLRFVSQIDLHSNRCDRWRRKAQPHEDVGNRFHVANFLADGRSRELERTLAAWNVGMIDHFDGRIGPDIGPVRRCVPLGEDEA